MKETSKPTAVVYYNTCKQGIDLSDQLSSYYTPLRKTNRWYHKVAFEYILGAAVTNPLILYNTVRGIAWKMSDGRGNAAKKPDGFMTLLQFRVYIVKGLAGAEHKPHKRSSMTTRSSAPVTPVPSQPPSPLAVVPAAPLSVTHTFEKHQRVTGNNRHHRGYCTAPEGGPCWSKLENILPDETGKVSWRAKQNCRTRIPYRCTVCPGDT